MPHPALARRLFDFYFYLVVFAGALVICEAVTNFNLDHLAVLLLWMAFAIPIEMNPVLLNTKDQITLSFSINLAMVIIYGFEFAIIVSLIANVVTDAWGRRGWQKLLFNACQYAITIFLTGEVFYYFKKSAGIFLLPDDLPALILASFTYVTVNVLLVSVIVALSLQKPLTYVIFCDIGMKVLYFTTLAPISMLMVILYSVQPWGMLLLIPPLATAHLSYKSYFQLSRETRQTLEVISEIIDLRDVYTAQHSRRVAEYARMIAEQMNLPPEEVEQIYTAGMVHDLGKISVRDSVLLKPDVLTDEEYNVMKQHSKSGYEILKNLDMYKKGAMFVLMHHERVDGRGYPLGLRSSEIPLGARIMAVADSYDAMTTDRPYRNAMDSAKAMQILRENAGSQFDPAVVEVFCRIINKIQNKNFMKGGYSGC